MTTIWKKMWNSKQVWDNKMRPCVCNTSDKTGPTLVWKISTMKLLGYSVETENNLCYVIHFLSSFPLSIKPKNASLFSTFKHHHSNFSWFFVCNEKITILDSSVLVANSFSLIREILQQSSFPYLDKYKLLNLHWF